MTVLVHKGYQGSIEYEDGHIVIQLLHIDDFVSTSCDDSRVVENVFHSLVDEYLETCDRLGKEPNRPYKGSLNVRMPPDLHRSLAKAATQAGVSLNSWIVDACRVQLSTDTLAPGAAILGEGRSPLASLTATQSGASLSSPSFGPNILPTLMRNRPPIQQHLGTG
jgi:predicted HicB family RNase H-like nuclease